VQEVVQRFHPLLYTRLQILPFRRRDDPRQTVKRQDAIDRGRVGIDGEGDAQVDQIIFRARRAQPKGVEPDRADTVSHAVDRAAVARALGKLAEILAWVIAGEGIDTVHGHLPSVL
jgi:hypothetical protein